MGYRKYYFRNRLTWDIERQIGGEIKEKEEEKYVLPAIVLDILERHKLATILIN